MLGVVLAEFLGDPDWIANPNSTYEAVLLLKSAFLAALRMLIAPLIFFSLLGGITSLGRSVVVVKGASR